MDLVFGSFVDVCLCYSTGRKCLNYTNHTVMPEAPENATVPFLPDFLWKCPTSPQENWVYRVAPSTNHFTMRYFLDMTCLLREIDGNFPLLLLYY